MVIYPNFSGKKNSNEVNDIKKIEVTLDKKNYINLLFDKGHDLEERIINEQFIY